MPRILLPAWIVVADSEFGEVTDWTSLTSPVGSFAVQSHSLTSTGPVVAE